MRRVVFGVTVVSVVWAIGATLCVDAVIGGLSMTPALAMGREGPVEEVENVEQQRPATADHDALSALNGDYIRSVQTGDVARFDEILADDFRASLGTTYLDRAAFLAQTARPVTISNLAARDVEIRVMGDVGIVHARTTYRTAEGEDRSGRYTDVWVRDGDTWLAVAAHVTR